MSERFWVKLDRNRFYREIFGCETDAKRIAFVNAFAMHLFFGKGDSPLAAELLSEAELSHEKQQNAAKTAANARWADAKGNAKRIPKGNAKRYARTEQNRTVTEEEKNKDIAANSRRRKHPFEQSPLFDKKAFVAAFPDWDKDKCKYWYNAAVEYSGANGGRYLDWKLAIQAWERKDTQKEKKDGSHRKPTRAQRLDADAEELLRDLAGAGDTETHGRSPDQTHGVLTGT